MKKNLLVILVMLISLTFRMEAKVIDGGTVLVKTDTLFSHPIILKGTKLSFAIKNLKRIYSMQVKGEQLFLTFERKEDWGPEYMVSYQINRNGKQLRYETEYGKHGKNTYDFCNPVMFLGANDTLCVAERSFGDIFKVIDKGKLVRARDYVVGMNAKVPYAIVLEAKDVAYAAPHKYYFLGHQPENGSNCILYADNTTGTLTIKDVIKPIFDKRYPQWIANHGIFNYSKKYKTGVFAFDVCPGIDFYSMNDSNVVKKTIKLDKPIFKTSLLTQGDFYNKNVNYFVSLSQSDDYVYAAYRGTKYDDMLKLDRQNKAKTRIIKFDWLGNIKQVYQINDMIDIISVDKVSNTLIGCDGRQIFLYNL